MTKAAKPVPDGYHTITPQLTLDNAARTIDMTGGKGPKAYGGSPASLWVYVENCDALFSRAVGAGGTVQMPMEDQFWGDRAGAVADPEGYTWWIATRTEDVTPAEMEQRAADFFKQMPQPTTR